MRTTITYAAFAVLACTLGLGCDDSAAVKETSPDAATGSSGGVPSGGRDGGGEGGADDCVQNPKTHEEIINACTDAVKITKNPVLPKLLADGGLPPLQ